MTNGTGRKRGLDRRAFLLLGGAGMLAACSSSNPGPGPTTTGAPSATSEVSTVASGLNVPWGLAFLPSGDAVVGERETGRVLRLPSGGGAPVPLITLPRVDTTGTAEGGLLGLAVSPDYASDQLLFAYYTTDGGNVIVSFTADGGAENVKPITAGIKSGNIHNGGRIAFGPDGKLYAGVGETGERGLAQDLASPNGKILRMEKGGGVPSDNPFSGSHVWSYGHRNVQGLAWDSSGRLWASEFGQDRFDEVNLIEKGKNYGWPDVEGVGDTHQGKYTNPKVTWPTDAASPSGAAVVGDRLYIGALQGKAVLRVRLNGTSAAKDTPLFPGRFGRIRTAVAAPDGSLWFTTSNRDGRGDPRSGDDRILRLAL